jgi:hypothetical protein
LLCHAHGLPEAKRNVYSLFDTAVSLRGLPNSDEMTLFRGHYSTGSGRRLETRQIPVTFPTLPDSILQTRALRDATPLGGWIAPVPGPPTGREKKGGSLELAWNWLGTPVLL